MPLMPFYILYHYSQLLAIQSHLSRGLKGAEPLFLISPSFLRKKKTRGELKRGEASLI